MYVICPLSGVEHKTTLFSKRQATHPHPLFSLSAKDLLSLSGQWASGRFSEQERRLLFIALLHKSSLIDFRTIPLPSDATIQLHMEPLLRSVNWITNASPVIFNHLPRFVISHETCKLTNIHSMLGAWEDGKKRWYEGRAAEQERSRLDFKEAALEKLIKSASKSSENYAGQLADWAILASGMTNALTVVYWKRLFKLKGFDIYNVPLVDLEELVEHLEDNIPHGSIQAHAVMKHVRMLRDKNKKGLDAELGLLNGSTFELLEDEVQLHNIRVASSSAPIQEPLESMIGSTYKTKVDFLRAKAAYRLALSQQQKQELVAEKHKETIKEIALDIQTDEELSSQALNDQLDLQQELGL